MAARKRTQAQRELDLAEMAKLLRRGWTQTRLAERFGLSRQQMGYDWQVLLERLQAGQELDTRAARAIKLQEYGEIKEAAWGAWERSGQDRTRTVTEVSQAPAGAKGGGGDRQKAIEAIEGRLPGHEYLRVVLACIEGERELLGLDPPKRHAHGGDEDAPAIQMNHDVRDQAKILEEYREPFTDFINSVLAGPGFPPVTPDDRHPLPAAGATDADVLAMDERLRAAQRVGPSEGS